MRRRSYLVGAIIALTGCVGGGGSDGESTSTSHPPLPESVARTVRVIRADTIPEQYKTEATVEVVEPQITTDHTTQLRVTVRNTGDERREYTFNPNPPMSREESDSGPGTLLLARPLSLNRQTSDCWRLASYQHGDGRVHVELAPGEAVQNTLEVWDVGDGPCLPPGRYRFITNGFRFLDSDDTSSWSFTLGIEES